MTGLSIPWPDLAIAAVLFIGGFRGWRKGFFRELAGLAALALGLIAPWFYRGGLDDAIAGMLRIPTAIAHVVAMLLIGILCYAAVLLAARVLTALARAPFLGFGNAAAGAAIGLFKAVVLVWIALYVGLFFPLSPHVRAALHDSVLARAIAGENGLVDASVIGALPAFARPFAQPIFDRHRL